MLAAIMPSLALASLDPADFAELRPYLSIARIAVLLLVIAGMRYGIGWQSARFMPTRKIERTHLNDRSAHEEGKLYVVDHHISDDRSSWPRGLRTHRPLFMGLAVLVILIRAAPMIGLSYFKLKIKAGA